MAKADGILKVDVAGRAWTPRERRELLLDEYERSGTPAAKFAVLVGVKPATFAGWVQQRRRQRGGADGVLVPAGGPTALKWVEAAVEAGAESGARALVVHLPGGARMEVADAAQAALAAVLLRALEAGGGAC
jgi:transposase-like protein